MSILFFTVLAIAIDMVSAVRKKQGREAAFLLVLGVLTAAYGYYYSTHSYTSSLVDAIFKLLNM